MKTKSICALGLAAALVGLLLVPLLRSADPPKHDTDAGIKPEQFKPRWQVGQKWIVETVSKDLQARRDEKQLTQSDPVQWQFEVKDIEKVEGKDCYKVQIECLLGTRAQPVTTIWLNAKSMMLQKLQTQFPVQGGFRTVTEHYSAKNPAPVLAPLTVLPLEMPVFLDSEGQKGLEPETFTYEASEAPAGSKDPGDVGFAFSIQQHLSNLTPDQAKEAKGLVKENFSKGLEDTPLVNVQLKGPGRKVSQLWQADQPWPVYSNNGPTTARLVKVIPPAQPK